MEIKHLRGMARSRDRPHSLGTLIEWKLDAALFFLEGFYVPTRWGH